MASRPPRSTVTPDSRAESRDDDRYERPARGDRDSARGERDGEWDADRRGRWRPETRPADPSAAEQDEEPDPATAGAGSARWPARRWPRSSQRAEPERERSQDARGNENARGYASANGADLEAPAASSPGEILRTARLRRRISLAEAEQATRIRLQYLQAIEDDDVAALPVGVYSHGFVRNYAIYLGVPPEDVTGAARPRRIRERAPDLRAVTRPVRVTAPRATWLIALVALVLTLAVVVIAWLGLTAPSETAHPAPAASPTPLVQLPPLAPPATATAAPTAVPTAAPTQGPARQVDVDLRVVDRSWVRATVDGRVVLEEILPTGAVQHWTGQQSVLLRVGNAGGVDVTVNGQRVGVLGPAGQPMDREFTR